MDGTDAKRVAWYKHRECSVLVVVQSQSFSRLWRAEWLVTAFDGPCQAAAGRCRQTFRILEDAIDAARLEAITEIQGRLAPALRALVPNDIC